MTQTSRGQDCSQILLLTGYACFPTRHIFGKNLDWFATPALNPFDFSPERRDEVTQSSLTHRILWGKQEHITITVVHNARTLREMQCALKCFLNPFMDMS